MRDYSIQNKKAWEYSAYDFWVKHSGTPIERAGQDIENPLKDVIAPYTSEIQTGIIQSQYVIRTLSFQIP